MIKSGINGEIRNENECRFNRSIAMICGIRPALIAQYLWEIMEYENGTADDYWRKMPQKMIQTVYPFLSRHMIRDAMKELTECRILRASERNESRFDRTRWYQLRSSCRSVFRRSMTKTESTMARTSSART